MNSLVSDVCSETLKGFSMAIECAIAHAKEGDNEYWRVLSLRLSVIQMILMRRAGSSASAREHSPSSFGLVMKHLGTSALSIEGDFRLIFEDVATSFFGDPQLLEISQFLVAKYYGGLPSAADRVAVARAKLFSDAVETARQVLGAAQQEYDAALASHLAGDWPAASSSARTDRAGAWIWRARACVGRASAAARDVGPPGYEVLP